MPDTLRPRARRGLQLLAVLVFLLHAGNYLYFFVDDEAIPFVHAQNLLEGRGLTYSGAEGRVEGYSDFLHVVLATGLLGAVRTFGAPAISVFFLGKIVSLACGIGIVWLTAATLRRLGADQVHSLAASLGIVVLAGPLAVWACSSLEAVPFALGVAALVYALCGDTPLPRVAAPAALFLALERVDGFVWAGALGAAFGLFGGAAHRRVALRYVLVPAAVATAGVELFRLAYFGTWAPMPVYAKVLFKLQDNGQLVKKLPAVSYAASFVGLYGALPLATAGALALPAIVRRRDLRALAVAVLALGAYVAIVGDWMFGFRFFVPLIAPAAVLVGFSLARWPRRFGAAVALASVAWCGIVARTFEREYREQRLEVPRHNFWREPSLAAGRFFGPYYGLLSLLGPVAPAGTLISYNQAGLVPFLLDAPNIDTLGVCSRYYAQLPATDVAYTEVGRYEPLTADPVISARRAYLLNRAPRFLVERTDLLARNNGGRIPGSLFGGYYSLLAVDAPGQNAVFQWAGLPAVAYRRDDRLFVENLLHISNLDRATAGGRVVAPRESERELACFRERETRVVAAPEYTFALRIRPAGAAALQIYVKTIASDEEIELRLTLRAGGGRPSWRWAQRLPAGRSTVLEPLPAAPPAKLVELSVRALGAAPAHVVLSDVRLMGQTPALSAYVRANVPLEITAPSAGAAH